MKKIISRYGLISAAFLVVLFALTWILSGPDRLTYSQQEVAGYLTMLIATSFAFFAIRYYRDKENGGLLSFGQGMKVGTLVVLFPAIACGLLDLVYVKWVNPGFLDRYYADELETLRKSLPAAAFTQRSQEMLQEKEMFSNPLLMALVMFATVFLIGLIITVISSLILKRKNVNPR